MAAPFAVGVLPGWLFAAIIVAGMALAAYAAARSSPMAANAALTIVSTALGIALLDLAMRALGLGPPVLLERWPAMPQVIRFLPNIERADMQYADLAQMIGPTPPGTPRARVATDARGFRNEKDAPRRGVDVVVLGDSFGAGATSNEDTIRGSLARDHGLRALDLSTPASSPWQEYVNFAVEQPHFEAKPGALLAWIVFEGNDLDDEYGPLDLKELERNGTAAQWLHRARAWRARSPLRHLVQARQPSREVAAVSLAGGRRMLFYEPYVRNAARDEAAIRSHPNFARLRATLARGAALARERGMRTVIFITPSKERVYGWMAQGSAPPAQAPASGFARALLAVCADEGLRCVDLAPGLAAESARALETGRFLFWLDDTHPNAEGNRYIARRIRESFAAP